MLTESSFFPAETFIAGFDLIALGRIFFWQNITVCFANIKVLLIVLRVNVQIFYKGVIDSAILSRTFFARQIYSKVHYFMHLYPDESMVLIFFWRDW